MKNLFGIDITEDKLNSSFEGSIFITKTLDPTIKDNFNKVYKKKKELIQKGTANGGLVLAALAAFFISAIFVLNFVLDIIQIGLIPSFQNSAVKLLISAAPITFVGIVIHINSAKRRKNAESEDYIQCSREFDDAMNEALRYMGIPQNADKTDIFAEKFKVKNEQIKHVNSQSYTHNNFSFYIYVKDSNLCLCNIDVLFEIPLTSIKDIWLEKKKATFPKWYKEAPIDSPKYKKFKVSRTQNAFSSRYYTITINDIKGDFTLLIPVYDIDIFSSLTRIYENSSI